MDEKITDKSAEMELDISRLVAALLKKVWLLVAASVAGALLAFFATLFFITPKYESSAMFYVNNNALSVGSASFSISSSDITAAKSLVDSYIVILQTRESLNDVIDYAGVDRTYKELREMVTASSVNATEIFEVVVTSPYPEEAEAIANAIAYILPKRISSIIEGTSAKVVDAAVLPVVASSPSYTNNTLIGLVLGLVLSAAIILMREIFDVTIRTEEDIEQLSKHPILVSVPNMNAPSKGKYHYYTTDTGTKKKPAVGAGKEPILVGSGISFAASEAYKLLRTKIQFSFADESDCHVIGVSSAMAGEGKSLSSVNLAYSLSQLGKKVVLIDCDMRRPSLPDKLPVQKIPGLSGYLSSQHHLDEIVQKCGIPESEDAFDVIASGQNPPNPVELLSSGRMVKLLNNLRGSYDYIILDFPPVGEVSDAMAVAKEVDGILLVVRQNYCNRLVLSSAIRQFEFVDFRILGVIYNCTSDDSVGYGKKYYRGYGAYHKYGDYAAAAQSEKKSSSGKRKS